MTPPKIGADMPAIPTTDAPANEVAPGTTRFCEKTQAVLPGKYFLSTDDGQGKGGRIGLIREDK